MITEEDPPGTTTISSTFNMDKSNNINITTKSNNNNNKNADKAIVTVTMTIKPPIHNKTNIIREDPPKTPTTSTTFNMEEQKLVEINKKEEKYHNKGKHVNKE